MRILLQRVSEAHVLIEGDVVAEIKKGILLLTGFCHEDGSADLARIAEKVVNLRIFPDQNDRLQYALSDIDGGVLVVPQFTLYGAANRGRRPDFIQAMQPELATERFESFVKHLQTATDCKVEQGVFGANMQLHLVNDGPLTLQLEY